MPASASEPRSSSVVNGSSTAASISSVRFDSSASPNFIENSSPAGLTSCSRGPGVLSVSTNLTAISSNSG